MNSKTILTIASTLVLPLSMLAQAGNMQNGQDMNSGPGGQQEAMQMVRAQGALMKTLDANQASPGTDFQIKLTRSVQLQNGPKLPSGTMLVGKVATDDMQMNGQSKLALRITQADLKDGQTVPIRATIVGFARPESIDDEGNYVEAGDQAQNEWRHGILAVDQINAVPHVDMHSKIESQNSAVFVSKDQKDVKLKSGSEFELAIAPRNNSANGMAGGTQ